MENVCVPKNLSGVYVTNRFDEIFGKYGSILIKQAFVDTTPVDSTLLEQLALGGVQVVDVKKFKQRKDVADKMLMVQMFLFAIDHPPPATIILLSGDVDFCCALSALKSRGYHIVLVPAPCSSRTLMAIPNEICRWDSLLKIGEEVNPMEIETVSAESSSSRNFDHLPLPRRDIERQHGDENISNSVFEFLDVLLEFKDQGLISVLASKAGVKLSEKYPSGFQKGQLRHFIDEAIRLQCIRTQGSGGGYTIIFESSVMDSTWERLMRGLPIGETTNDDIVAATSSDQKP